MRRPYTRSNLVLVNNLSVALEIIFSKFSYCLKMMSRNTFPEHQPDSASYGKDFNSWLKHRLMVQTWTDSMSPLDEKPNSIHWIINNPVCITAQMVQCTLVLVRKRVIGITLFIYLFYSQDPGT